MATLSNEQAPIAEALAGLTAALEHILARHEAAQRASRRARLALSVVGLLIVGGAIYLALSPVAHLLPLIVPQQLSAVDREALKAEKRQLLDTLPAEERARYEVFERQVEFLDKYMGAYEDLDIAAAIALFLARMSRSVEVMPDMYEQVRFMSNEVSSMNNEMISMDAKMSALPAMARDVRGMNGKMEALPILATEVQAMRGQVGVMAAGMDSTMGRAGRMMPWNW